MHCGHNHGRVDTDSLGMPRLRCCSCARFDLRQWRLANAANTTNIIPPITATANTHGAVEPAAAAEASSTPVGYQTEHRIFKTINQTTDFVPSS